MVNAWKFHRAPSENYTVEKPVGRTIRSPGRITGFSNPLLGNRGWTCEHHWARKPIRSILSSAIPHWPYLSQRFEYLSPASFIIPRDIEWKSRRRLLERWKIFKKIKVFANKYTTHAFIQLDLRNRFSIFILDFLTFSYLNSWMFRKFRERQFNTVISVISQTIFMECYLRELFLIKFH